jgi:hypothetical protein
MAVLPVEVPRREGRRPGRVRGVVMGGLASAIAVVGLVAFSTLAFAQDNAITANASCSSPLGNGVQITWTIANDSNVHETGLVTLATGGLGAALYLTAYSIAASPGQPSQTAPRPRSRLRSAPHPTSACRLSRHRPSRCSSRPTCRG